MVHPGLLVGWLLKQGTLWNMYSAAKAYGKQGIIQPNSVAPFHINHHHLLAMFIPHIHPGFHRVYRRLLEANHRLVSAPEDRKIIQDNIKLAMRFPTKVVEVMEESHTIAFLQKYANEIVSDVEAKAPPFFAAAAKIVLGKTPLGKMFSFFHEVRGAAARPSPPSPPPPPASPSSSSSSSLVRSSSKKPAQR